MPSAYSEMDGFEMSIHVPRLLNAASINATAVLPDLPSPYVHPLFYVLVYSAIGFGVASVGVLSNLVQLTGALRASRRLFTELLNNVVYATVRFHDTTPAGKSQIVNEFILGLTDT